MIRVERNYHAINAVRDYWRAGGNIAAGASQAVEMLDRLPSWMFDDPQMEQI